MIDSVRAARTFPASTGNRFVVWGHSQGGQAALFTGMIAKDYAPELELARRRGRGARDRPRDPDDRRPQHDRRPQPHRHDGVVVVTRLRRAARQRRRTRGAAGGRSPRGRMHRVAVRYLRSAARTAAPLAQEFLTVKNPAEIEPWHSLLVAQHARPAAARRFRVFLAQGTADGLVRPQVTIDYMRRLCRAGSRVRMLAIARRQPRFAGAKSADAARRLDRGPLCRPARAERLRRLKSSPFSASICHFHICGIFLRALAQPAIPP